MNITYITYQKINLAKWDDCINSATNGNMYATSFYLNKLAANWDALVLNEYEFVMPLTYNKKYGIYYLYQPHFCAQLGVFGKNLTKEIVSNFIKAIPTKYKYCDIYLNRNNCFDLPFIYTRNNYILQLNTSYQNLYAAFRDNIKRNVKKCQQLNLVLKKDIQIDEIIALATEQNKAFSNISHESYSGIAEIYKHLKIQKKATSYGIYLNENLLASAAFFFSHNRAYYILVGNHPDGKTLGASHALLNAFIEDHANQNLVLDFEGSDINSLAFFYSSFGAKEEKYSALKFNRLPWYIKWLKK